MAARGQNDALDPEADIGASGERPPIVVLSLGASRQRPFVSMPPIGAHFDLPPPTTMNPADLEFESDGRRRPD